MIQGEIHGLIGENGAGKSTLVKILSGIYPEGDYDGVFYLSGEMLKLQSPNDALKMGIGIVPQEINVLDDLPVFENIAVGKWGGDNAVLISLNKVSKEVAKFLEDLNIDLDPMERTSRLTAAQKQVLMIARALYSDPQVLILDEPTSSLSSTEIDVLFNVLDRLRDRGITIIFITHKLKEIFQMTDRTTVLRDGEVAGNFTREEYNENDIISAMVGRTIENYYPARIDKPGKKEVLRVNKLTIEHPVIANRNLVEDVSFSLYDGEILGLAGLVGSGRSEVVNAISGRIPYKGEIYIDNRLCNIRNTSDAKSNGIALITEDRKNEGLLFDLPIRPNISLNVLKEISSFSFIRGQQEKDLAMEYLGKLNIIAPTIESMVVNLSGGNQQKVVIGRALAGNPKIIMMDEPTKGVDVGAKNEIYKLMLDLVKEGISIVMISSELPELLGICDRFVVLSGGMVQDEFTRDEASDTRVMKAAVQALE